jgi:hypothetical protein
MSGLRSDAEARPNVRRLLALLLPPAFALYATFNGVQQISIPLQVEAVDPSRKVEQLGLIITLCSVASVLGLVSGGAISDATRSRFGRRRPGSPAWPWPPRGFDDAGRWRSERSYPEPGLALWSLSPIDSIRT